MKNATISQRDAAICAYYAAGHKMSECAARFKLGKQRILQILKKDGVWRRYEKTGRTKFLGVSITEATKDKLTMEALNRGVSVSKLTSDALDQMLEKEAK